jgi:hypothetical protein
MPGRLYGTAALLFLAGTVAACGGASNPPDQNDTQPVKLTPATSEGHIRDVVMRSYTSRDPADCERIFTTAFIHAAWQDADGCRKHLRQLAKVPPRTVRVIDIRRQGPVADAHIRVDNIDSTVKLVLTSGQWQIDDTVSQGGSARTNLAQARQEALARQKTRTVGLGQPVRFAPVAGIGPSMNFSVTVLRVVPDGFARNGVSSGTAPLTDDFGTVTNKGVAYRVVNVQVRVSNHGPASFRGTFSASVIGTGGRTWPAAVHVGRRPDWTDGESHGIKPGHGSTRWITVAMPAAGLPKTVKLEPEVLSKPNTVTAVTPEAAHWRAQGR